VDPVGLTDHTHPATCTKNRAVRHLCRETGRYGKSRYAWRGGTAYGGGNAIITASHVTVVKVKYFLKEPPSDALCETALWKLCGLLCGHCKGPCRRTWPLLRWRVRNVSGGCATEYCCSDRYTLPRCTTGNAVFVKYQCQDWYRSVCAPCILSAQCHCDTFRCNPLLEHFLLRRRLLASAPAVLTSLVSYVGTFRDAK
jgi:hypothetical protein